MNTLGATTGSRSACSTPSGSSPRRLYTGKQVLSTLLQTSRSHVTAAVARSLHLRTSWLHCFQRLLQIFLCELLAFIGQAEPTIQLFDIAFLPQVCERIPVIVVLIGVHGAPIVIE